MRLFCENCNLSQVYSFRKQEIWVELPVSSYLVLSNAPESVPDLFQAGEIGKQMDVQAGKQALGLFAGEVELLCKGEFRIHWTRETKDNLTHLSILRSQ